MTDKNPDYVKVKISILNRSTLISDAQVQKVVRDLQIQVDRDFKPMWGIDADLSFISEDMLLPLDSWWLTFFDDSNQANAAGYHDVTTVGLPVGKVFVKTDIDNFLEWSVTASHELLEMLGDPDVNLTAFTQTGPKAGTLYAYEVCDPVEDDQYSYLINDTRVSNFVYPSYFEPDTSAGRATAKYDYCGHLTAPVPTLLPGGYLSKFSIPGENGWTQNTMATEGQPHRGHLKIPVKGSRAERRQRRNNWTPTETRFIRM